VKITPLVWTRLRWSGVISRRPQVGALGHIANAMHLLHARIHGSGLRRPPQPGIDHCNGEGAAADASGRLSIRRHADGGRLLGAGWKATARPEKIDRRLDAVDELTKNELLRGASVITARRNDIERLVSRCAAGPANARDLVGLKESLDRLPPIRDILYGCRSNAYAIWPSV